MMNLPNNKISARKIYGLHQDRFIHDKSTHDKIIVRWNFHVINLIPIKWSHEEIVHNKFAQNEIFAELSFPIMNFFTITTTLKHVRWSH